MQAEENNLRPNYKKLVVYLIVLILIGGGICFWLWLTRPVDSSGKDKSFTVKSGQTTRQIGQNLQSEGFIRSANCFLIIARVRAAVIQAGIYQISSAETINQIFSDLTGEASEYLVTIPEGWRVTQIDAQLASKGITNPGEFTRIASGDEGYLFPDTYRFLPKSDPLAIREEMLENFKTKTEGLNVDKQTIIIASIVEREAKFDEDRPKIARVYLNRLTQGMRLEADPTIQYAKGSWDPITVSDYQNVDSLYNTYLHDGLPPGSICNPGLKSIKAVISPDSNNYLYFFHKADGHAVYSVTKAEHEENLKKYRE